jgi:hypothetical protein
MPKYLPQHPTVEHPSLCSSPHVRDQASHPYKITGKITAVYIFILMFFNNTLEKYIKYATVDSFLLWCLSTSYWHKQGEQSMKRTQSFNSKSQGKEA